MIETTLNGNYEVKWKKDPITGRTRFTKKPNFDSLTEATDAYATLAYRYGAAVKSIAFLKGLGWFKTAIIIVMSLHMIFG